MSHWSTGGSSGAPRRFTPYSRPGPRERQPIPRGPFDLSTPSTGPVPETPNPLPPASSGAGNPTASAAAQPPPSWSLIQQPKYTPPRTYEGFTPEDPIYFFINGTLGISVSQAADGDYTGLDGRDDRMSGFKSTSASFRIQFTEYGPYASKVNTRDYTTEWKPILRCKLAKEVGRRVKQYIEREGLQDTIATDKVYLTRLIHVSKGSWQPELWRDDL